MKPTREEAIRLAEEAGIPFYFLSDTPKVPVDSLQRLITLAKNEAFKEAAEVCIAFHEDAERSMFSCCEDAILALIEELK